MVRASMLDHAGTWGGQGGGDGFRINGDAYIGFRRIPPEIHCIVARPLKGCGRRRVEKCFQRGPSTSAKASPCGMPLYF